MADVGAILAGQIRIMDPEETLPLNPKIIKFLEDPEMKAAYDAIPYTTKEKAEASAELMYLVANYIVSVGMNKFVQEELNKKNIQLGGIYEIEFDENKNGKIILENCVKHLSSDIR